MGCAIEKTVNIGKQYDACRARRLRNACGQTVIIAKTDFFGGDAIIFVDDGHGACAQETIKRRGDIQIPAAILKVIERHQHLRSSQGVSLQQLSPNA